MLEHEPSPPGSTTPEEKRLKVMAHGKIRPGLIPCSGYHAPNGIHQDNKKNRDSNSNYNSSFSLPSAKSIEVQTVNSLIDAWQAARPSQGRGGGRPRKNKRIYVSVSQLRQAATGLVDDPNRKWTSPKAYLGQALVQFEQGVSAG